MNELDKIILTAEDGEDVEFYVVEQTRINGVDYLLVTDAPEGTDGDAYILKDTSADGEEVANYEFVEDDAELNAVSGVFESMLDDIDLK